jgi:hypothetical protein
MKPIAIFYHTVFFKEDGSPFEWSVKFNDKYMRDLTDSGLMDASQHFVAGINGGQESEIYAKLCLPKAQHVFHGLAGTSTNYTTDLMRNFCGNHPGWNVLFFHSKGLAHSTPDYASYVAFEARWIKCMVNACIYNWRTCVEDLETHDMVGCHWMKNVGVPPVDNIFGGTFFWGTSDFIATLPPIQECPRVKQYGINSAEARATSEQYPGLGPKLPITKDYCVHGIGMCP